jgi:hypothetical protein
VVEVSDRPIYKVVADRDGRWWTVTVPDLPGVHTQARTVEGVDAMAREAIAMMFSPTTGADVAEDDFDLDVEVRVSPKARRVIDSWERAAERAEKARAVAAARQEAAARALVAEGLTLKDAGQVLGGLSLQRVGQLVGKRRGVS